MKANDPTLEHLREKLTQYINQRSEWVAEGACEDFSEYRFQSGFIEGMKTARRELMEVDEMLHRNDDV